ncbi:MAG: glutaredoxin domain-containing protein, partial [Actinomycetes bacterium]
MMNEVTVYSTTWCGSCKRLKTQLTREGISFTDVDIEQDPGAADIVAAANNGDHLVPT